MRRSAYAVLVLVLLAATVVPLAWDLTEMDDPRDDEVWWEPERWWGYDGPYRIGDSLPRLIERLTVERIPNRYRHYASLSVAAAAREIAGGTPGTVFAPEDDEDLRVPGPGGENAVVPDFMIADDFMAGRLRRSDYDHVVEAPTVEGWDERAELVDMPWHVTAVVPPESHEGSQALFRVETSETVRTYVVPEPLWPEGVRP